MKRNRFTAKPLSIPVMNPQPGKQNLFIKCKRAGSGGGGSDGDSIPDPSDLPSRVGIFMAGTHAAPHSSATAAIVSGSTVAGAGGSMRPPAQVLSDLFDALAVLMAEANPTDRDAHNTEIAKVREQIQQAKADLAAEETRMAAERAALNAQAYKLMLDQNASQEVLRRKYRSRLPSVFEGRDLFNTPGAGTSNPPVLNRSAVPGPGAPVQPRVTDLPPHNPEPRIVTTLPDHYS